MSEARTPTRRGRPRAFDRAKALHRAMRVFWACGYEGASMARLTEAMGINSPSVYAAFGSKEDLFREAIALYAAGEGGVTWRALSEVADMREAVRAMLVGAVEAFAGSDGPRGCLIVLGGGHRNDPDDTVGILLRDERYRIRRRLGDRFAAAAGEGALPPDRDPDALAGCVMAFLDGLSIEAADGVPASALGRSVDLFLDRLL